MNDWKTRKKKNMRTRHFLGMFGATISTIREFVRLVKSEMEDKIWLNGIISVFWMI